MRRIAKISGRSDDMLIIRGVNVFPSQIETEILKCAQLAPHYLISVWRDGPLDALSVTVEGRAAMDPEAQKSNAQELQKLLKTFIGISAQVEIVTPGSLPRSQGKAARVDDRRP